MPIERKLAAIMFTDIAGYTALSAKDENKALALLDKQEQILTVSYENRIQPTYIINNLKNTAHL